jgi:hypothetical protein
MGPAVSGAGDSFEGMRRVGCGCEVPKTGFWDVGSLPNRLLKNSILILGGAAAPLRYQTCFQYRLQPLRATAVLKLSFSASSQAHTP